jgi:hypothetical protein
MLVKVSARSCVPKEIQIVVLNLSRHQNFVSPWTCFRRAGKSWEFSEFKCRQRQKVLICTLMNIYTQFIAKFRVSTKLKLKYFKRIAVLVEIITSEIEITTPVQLCTNQQRDFLCF